MTAMDEYCSPLETYATNRRIPPLQTLNTFAPSQDKVTIETQILHLSVIFRHGSRAPYAPLQCWANYDSRWDCPNGTTTYMSPATKIFQAQEGQAQIQPSGWTGKWTSWFHHSQQQEPSEVVQQEADGMPFLLFQQDYDALMPPLHNLLGGTCVVGQLLPTGYEQLRLNGELLRQAYLENSEQPFMNLSPDNIYLRSDDEQRTLLSLQILVESLLSSTSLNSPIIKLHTADYTADIVAPNESVCPALGVLAAKSLKDHDYIKHVKENAALRQELRQKLDTTDANLVEFVDCTMTQFCNNRTLPDALLTDNKALFEKAFEYYTWDFSFKYQYNQAQYSKLAIGPLWKEILGPVNMARNVTSSDNQLLKLTPRISLFSGHDTTLAPLLITLGVWDQKWIPYASMIIIETHLIVDPELHKEVFPSGHAFRLLYNGQVLTPSIDECTMDLCDLDVLLKLVGPIAKFDIEGCSVTSPHDLALLAKIQAAKAGTYGPSSSEFALWVCFAALVSSLITATVMICVQRRREARSHKFQQVGAIEQSGLAEQAVLDEDQDIEII